MTSTERITVSRFGRETTVDVCPSCLGRGSKWINDESQQGAGRPTVVRDLRGIEKAQAARWRMKPHEIWPCVACQGEGYR